VDWKLELVVLPVADMDRAKAFYVDQAGFALLVDHSAGEDFRVIQLTPPGSACAIALMKNTEAPGSVKGVHLVVNNLDAARAELIGRGATISDAFHFEEGTQVAGASPDHGDYESFFSFADPDGNEWMVQEVGWSGPA
jgi:catechol 2,3-dioxygenase-like lactoylglutathione lyase family enzyme